MGLPLELLEAELLRLPKDDRIKVLDRVVASLEADSVRDAAWDAVAKERQDQAERDPNCLVAIDHVLGSLRSELR